jgi:probable phosphoglycerate mutase
MSEPTSRCILIRHGATEWSKNGRHTGRTDLPLLPEGEVQARELAPLVDSLDIRRALVSPLQRAGTTANLAGLADRSEIDDDLLEWDYGDMEGRTSAEIAETRPGWNLFVDGPTNGETIEDVAARVDRVIARVKASGETVAAVAHGHVLRVLGARWLGEDPHLGQHLLLDPATISVLAWEHGAPAIKTWNSRGALS